MRIGNNSKDLVFSPDCLLMTPGEAADVRRKHLYWRFHHRPLPLNKSIYVFEDDPVHALTGIIYLGVCIGGPRWFCLDKVAKLSPYPLFVKYMPKPARRPEDDEFYAHLIVRSRWYEDPVRPGNDEETGIHLLGWPTRPYDHLRIRFRDHACGAEFFYNRRMTEVLGI